MHFFANDRQKSSLLFSREDHILFSLIRNVWSKNYVIFVWPENGGTFVGPESGIISCWSENGIIVLGPKMAS